MNQNPPLTAEEAKNLTFPCLLEVWDGTRKPPVYDVIVRLNQDGKPVGTQGSTWNNAALPPAEIAEAMRKQFAPKSEFPKRMLVWDDDESQAEPRIVLANLGEKTFKKYITVLIGDESKFENGEIFGWTKYKNAKPLPEPDPIALEIAELRQRLADLEAKHNQQSK